MINIDSIVALWIEYGCVKREGLRLYAVSLQHCWRLQEGSSWLAERISLPQLLASEIHQSGAVLTKAQVCLDTAGFMMEARVEQIVRLRLKRSRLQVMTKSEPCCYSYL